MFYVKSMLEKTILNMCKSISWEIHDSKLFLEHQTQQHAMSQNDTVKIEKNCKDSDADKNIGQNENEKHQSKMTRHVLSWLWLECIFTYAFIPLAF